ncbi:MAG TPA: MarR family transcriptional regulator, partial [Candidatus Baltobacteraceae bacterium]
GLALTDTSTLEVVGRLHRVVSYIDGYIGPAFTDLGLKPGEVEVLLTLALGSGEPLSPTAVASQLLCSTGAMTNRLDRLEKSGLLKRQHDTQDRRAILLSITTEGRKAAKRAAAARDALTDKLLPGLTMAERKTLVGLLRKMLVAFEATAADDSTGNAKRVVG